MARVSNKIDPKTGKRVGWVDPRTNTALAQAQALKAEAAQRELLFTRKQVAEKARGDLLTFTKFTMPDPEHISDPAKSRYEAAPFHEAIARVLEQVERGDIRQLIFCMPPRHGKSELATVRLAAWYSGRNPYHDVIVAAAGDELAADFGGNVRAIMLSPAFHNVFPKHKLRGGGKAKDNIQTVEGGRLIFAGRGGQINGRGAHLLLIDDLYKDAKEARSEIIRNDAWEWFTRVALKRRMGKKQVIITMTRWHSDDIVGRLTDPENPHYNEEEAKSWKIIRLPGLAEDDETYRVGDWEWSRKKGEALWPERFDVAYHEADRRRDPLGFEALTQQNPTVADGVLFRRENVRYWRHGEAGGGVAALPDNLRFYCSSDHAVATGQRNDFTCLLKAGVDAYGNIYLIDCFWQKVRSDAAVEAMLAMASGAQAPLLWWAERGHISKSIGPFLYKRMQETDRFINLVEVTPIGDKEQRAQSIAARFGMGKVFFPAGAAWTERAISELMAFPNGTRDDFVDALAYIGLGLRHQVNASPPKVEKKAPAFGTLGWIKQADTWAADEARRRASGGF